MNEFLSQTLPGAGSAIGQGIGLAVGAATGQFKGRPQWRDLEFMNDVANRLTPDEARRQNTFLDMTWGEDTRRMNERVMQMGKELGMNPWELTGTGAGTQQIAPVPSASGESANKFLSGLGPMANAKLQAQTQLQIAAMANQTQLKIAELQQGGGDLAKSQVSLNKAHEVVMFGDAILRGDQSALTRLQATATDQSIKESIARVTNLGSQTALTNMQAKREALGMQLSVIDEIRKSLPEVVAKNPFGEIRGRVGNDQILRMLDANKLSTNALANFSDQDIEAALRETTVWLKNMATGLRATSTAGNDWLTGTVGAIGDFLSNKKWDDPNAYKMFKGNR